MKKQLHAKDKGTLGQLAVAKELMRRGLPVFMECGDNSKADLIVIRKNRCIRIQVKAYKRSADKNTVAIYGTKSGPNYKFTYKQTDFEIFAIYLYEIDEILYVPLREVLLNKSNQITIRFKKSKNNQSKGVRLAENYKSFNRAVKNS